MSYEECPNPECYLGQVDDIAQPRGCLCCTYVMVDCPVCRGLGVVPSSLDTPSPEPVGSPP